MAKKEQHLVATTDEQTKARARLFADIANHCKSALSCGEKCGHGFIEVVALEESWLSDRLESWLMATKNPDWQKRQNGKKKYLSLGDKIQCIRTDQTFITAMNDYLDGRTRGKAYRLTDEEYNFIGIGRGDAGELLDKWREWRNTSVHQLAVLSEEDVKSGRCFAEKYNAVAMTAKIGMKLLRIVSGICTKARNRAKAKNKRI